MASLEPDSSDIGAAPVWATVLGELEAVGMDDMLRGSLAAPCADGSWLVWTPDARNLDWLKSRGVKQIARKLGPTVGVPASALTVAFTADRAEYLEATGAH